MIVFFLINTDTKKSIRNYKKKKILLANNINTCSQFLTGTRSVNSINNICFLLSYKVVSYVTFRYILRDIIYNFIDFTLIKCKRTNKNQTPSSDYQKE